MGTLIFGMSPILSLFSLLSAGLILGMGGLAANTVVEAPLVAELRAEAAAAEVRLDVPEALRLYRELEPLAPDDAFVLQKIAQQLSDLSLSVATNEEKKAQAEQALAYAQRAVALQPNNAVNILSLAICYGKMAVFSDTRTKIEYSRKVREYAEEALRLDPNYDWAHHVLGRWHHEVADLGFGKRLVVRMVYGGLPPADKSAALTALRRAVELASWRVPHHVELGFAELASGNRAAARAAFEAALALPSSELYDESAKARAATALAALAN
jgi:hypothetical protein